MEKRAMREKIVDARKHWRDCEKETKNVIRRMKAEIPECYKEMVEIGEACSQKTKVKTRKKNEKKKEFLINKFRKEKNIVERNNLEKDRKES